MAVTNTMTKSNLVGGMVFLVYVSLLEASLREMRAGTKLSKGRDQGGQLSTALLTLTFFLSYSYSQVRLPRDGIVGLGLSTSVSNKKKSPQTHQQASLMEAAPHLRLLLPR